MTTINAYLNFNGKCREVLTFYHGCLGGDLFLQKISGSPMALHLPSRAGEKILHGSLILNGNILLMGSDMTGMDLVQGNQITLYLNCGNEPKMQDYFSRLAKDGEIKLPLHQNILGATYGELTDRYGIHWMFNYSRMLNESFTPQDPIPPALPR